MLSASPSYLPQLQGLRGVAALGVLATHVAFQTGVENAVLTRFDFFVATFFSLSAFLLARSYAANPTGYYARRAVRILPAYWVMVLLTLALFPVAFGAGWLTTLSTLSFTQIYVPSGLHGGLTHLWSLCVEVAFYLALPLIIRWRRWWWALGLAGFAWALIPWPFEPDGGGINFQIFPFSYLPWFVVGLYAAAWEGRLDAAKLSAGARWLRPVCWGLALLMCWVAGQQWYGPLGLEHPTGPQFALRLLAGTGFAALVLYPYVFLRAPSLLDTAPMQAVGRWSYSLFLWHIPVLSLVFPLMGIGVFQGQFFVVLFATAALSIAVAFVSYTLVESPSLQWWKGRQTRRYSTQKLPLPQR
ncbi:acyltransferase family protein [Corynebacterium kozikiae]|uniref:acyltransferase family protein n=1 Tax=Corynebacterium kozikiae TaxID=2968469 RepID=UPI00211BB935|nr:acyltransferase [Corynebacterium sp. 76QC2CO]MCQ9342955.1 acyltransferase [Corynebacterium sp. 76QC2CO]